MSESKWETVYRYGSGSLCRPACRMVVVVASEGRDGEGWLDVLPVVALRGLNCRRYEKWNHVGRDAESMTERQMLASGWTLRHEFVTHPLVQWDADELYTPEDIRGVCDCCVHVMTADWPPEEDDARLAEVKKELLTEARDLAVRKRRERDLAKAESLRRLLDWVRKHEGGVTPEDLQKASPPEYYPRAKYAENRLGDLVAAGLASWVDQPPGPDGGKPARRCVANDEARPSPG